MRSGLGIRGPAAPGGHVHSDPFQGLGEKGSRGFSPDVAVKTSL